MAAGSLVVAPLQYPRSSPPAFIRRAVRRRRILPPLLFLLLTCFCLVEFMQVMADAAAATNAEEALERHWQELRRLDPWTFVGRAGGVFLLLWLACEVVTSALAGPLARPREPLRQALLYLGGIAVLCLGLGTIVVSAAMFGGEGTIYETPTFLSLATPLAVGVWAVPFVCATGLGVYVARRLRRLGRLPGGPTGRAAFLGVAIGLPLLLAALFGLVGMAADGAARVGRALSLTAWLDEDQERLRRFLQVDALHCRLAGKDLRCTLLLRSWKGGPVLLEELLTVELQRPGPGRSRGASVSLPAPAVSWRPRLGEGDLLRLTSEATAVSLAIDGAALCEATAALTPGDVAGDGWSLRLDLSGYDAGMRGRGFERYQLRINLDSGHVAGIRRHC